MTKFLKLTETCSNDRTKILYVNVDNIKAFQVGNKGVDTMVLMMDKGYFFVKETPEEIWTMLGREVIIEECAKVCDKLQKYDPDRAIAGPIEIAPEVLRRDALLDAQPDQQED